MIDHNQRAFRFFGFIPWVIFGAAAIAGFAFLFGFILMHLWNWLMPFLFGLPELNYWQSWGLLLMAQILFKGPMHNSMPRNHRPGRSEDEWRQKFRRKFSDGFMKEYEEREGFHDEQD